MPPMATRQFGRSTASRYAAWASLYNAALAALPAPDDSEPPGDTDRTPTEG